VRDLHLKGPALAQPTMLPIAPASPWLIGRRPDLLWLIGSCGFAFAAVGAFLLFQGPLQLELTTSVLILQVVWSLGFDGTHLFATYSRTLFDRSFRVQQRSLLWSSAVVFAVGPLLVLGCHAALGGEGSRAASFAFHRFALTWAYYHVCRQHWGVAMLYRNKHGERDVWGRRLEAWLMSTGFAFPYIYATAHSSAALSPAELQWISLSAWHWTSVGLASVAGVSIAVAALCARRADPVAIEVGRCARGIAIGALAIAAYVWAFLRLGAGTVLEMAQYASGIAFAISAVLALAYAATRAGAWNRPKWMMIGSALLTHNVIFMMSDLPPTIPILALTLFHNIQYHRIVRFHNRNHYAAADAAQVGWAKRMTDDLVLFSGLALLYSVAYALMRVGSLQLMEHELAMYVASAFVWGFALHHYVLDAVIWRPSRSARLQSDLRIAS
jgi:hypothetical protein